MAVIALIYIIASCTFKYVSVVDTLVNNEICIIMCVWRFCWLHCERS
jgi:hypothetical protein